MVDLSIDTDQSLLAITISLGIAILDESWKTLDDLFQHTD